MAKTPLQIQSFLANNSYQSNGDWDMISAFCKDKAEFNVYAEINPESGITASEFIEWYEHGFGCGDIVENGTEIIMLGICHFKTAHAIATLSDDKILILDKEIATEGYYSVPEGTRFAFFAEMFHQKLQFSWKSLTLIEKYIPAINEKVIFHGNGLKGLGVVRDIDLVSGEVELYCYFLYTDKSCSYSMHEKGIVNLQDFIFEPMDNGDHRQSSLNGRACYQRLNRELNKRGKVWNDRLHRIEPLSIQVEVGKKYWYISDKMTLLQDEEKGLQLSRTRANAGNYFRDKSEGLDILGHFHEILRDRMAKDGI